VSGSLPTPTAFLIPNVYVQSIIDGMSVRGENLSSAPRGFCFKLKVVETRSSRGNEADKKNECKVEHCVKFKVGLNISPGSFQY
jgi:hypothetical protein